MGNIAKQSPPFPLLLRKLMDLIYKLARTEYQIWTYGQKQYSRRFNLQNEDLEVQLGNQMHQPTRKKLQQAYKISKATHLRNNQVKY